MFFHPRTKAAIALLALMVGLFLFETARADQESQDKSKQAIECLRAEYGDLPGFCVDYRRTIQTASMALLGGGAGEGDLATGTIYFMPPHFLKINQETPKREVVTTDGKTLWWYIPDKKKVHRYDSDEIGKELRVLADIFQGLKEVDASFKVFWDGHTERGDEKIRLVPDPPWSQTDHISISVTQGCRLRAIEIHNTVGNVTRFELHNLEPKHSLEPGFFSFSAPQGVQVITERGRP